MFLFMVIWFLGPIAVSVAGICSWKAMRRRRPALLIPALLAIALEALLILGEVREAQDRTPVFVAEQDAPGTYLRQGRDARDELRILADGTFARTASYRGVIQVQTGRWSYLAHTFRGAAYATIEFEALSPRCLQTSERPGTALHLPEPNEVLCESGTESADWCRVRGEGIAICLGELFEFVKQ